MSGILGPSVLTLGLISRILPLFIFYFSNLDLSESYLIKHISCSCVTYLLGCWVAPYPKGLEVLYGQQCTCSILNINLLLFFCHLAVYCRFCHDKVFLFPILCNLNLEILMPLESIWYNNLLFIYFTIFC